MHMPMPQVLGMLVSLAVAPNVAAQVPTTLSVFDAAEREIARVLTVDLDPYGGSQSQVVATFAGRVLVGVATRTRVLFDQMGMGTIYFEGSDCTGPASIQVHSGVFEPAPRLLDATVVVGTDRRVYVGNRADPGHIYPYNSLLQADLPCDNTAGSVDSAVEAHFLGTLPVATPPFRIGPASTAGGGGAPVAAVTPAALAFLAALLMLSGIAFLGTRRQR